MRAGEVCDDKRHFFLCGGHARGRSQKPTQGIETAHHQSVPGECNGGWAKVEEAPILHFEKV
jgi:hypothetical protein